jgi:hypothetical protein
MKICIFVLILAGLFLRGASAQDAIRKQDLIQPKALAGQLQAAHQPAPTVLFVGFPVMYRSMHIPGGILAGPCSKPEGLEALKKAALHLPRNREIILYCGCCPLAKCPNVKPAYTALREMGFSRIRVLELDTNFHTDWAAKGYLIVRGG